MILSAYTYLLNYCLLSIPTISPRQAATHPYSSTGSRAKEEDFKLEPANHQTQEGLLN